MTRASRCGALLVAFAAGGASCVSVSSEKAAASREAILGGDADVADVAVVAIRTSSTGALCSGTLVAPTVVLTAAHCVYGAQASDLQVLVGDDITSPTQTIAVASVTAYPTYTSEATGLAGGIDLGAVILSAPLTSVAPVAIDLTATDADLTGATVTLVGYGVSSTTDEEDVGIRREVSVPVSSVCSRFVTLGSAEGNVCFGDSGGAVLLGGALVAVVSSGSADCVAPSSQTRLSAHAAWLANVVAGNPAATCSACVQADTACDAPTETGASGEEDAGGGAKGASGGGGCSVRGGESGDGVAYGVGVGMALVAMRRRKRRRARE